MNDGFLIEDFFAALDAQREAKRLTWKKVASQAGVSASTLTRIAQGRRPDVDTLASLCRWAGLDANAYFASTVVPSGQPETLTQISTNLRADKNLSEEGARAIEAMLRAAYEQFRKDK
ncbi:helix-turn-helix domain-containing protein [Nioella ostreopsis]|uniref:helix-turn-helix domain-containing protein n=1 Tax=Nioella ostreopsis TaxID=2448479 RepID=UPI000FD8D613|nr:helix-turn-helix domain-containing protein [Nioella ostreopsis]